MAHEVQPERPCNLAARFSTAHCQTLGMIACAEGRSGSPVADARLHPLHQLARHNPIAYRDRINAYSLGFRAGHAAASQVVIGEATLPSDSGNPRHNPRKGRENDGS